jgi:hypothetical protein
MKDPRLERAGVSGYNKPKKTPDHPTKSHVVVAKEGDKVKLIRFGQQGVVGAGNAPKTEKDKARKRSYYARHNAQESLKEWTEQKWRTKSGKPSSETGERYLPEKAIKALTPAEYAATTRAKRAGTKAGKQFVAQPKSVAAKTAKFRK